MGANDKGTNEKHRRLDTSAMSGMKPQIANREDVAKLAAALHQGNENAFFTLIESPHHVVPMLIEEFQCQQEGGFRARIVEVIWRHRLPSTIPFLAAALSDSHPEVWKQAIDGLIAIGGAEARSALHGFRAQLANDDERTAWIDEALA